MKQIKFIVIVIAAASLTLWGIDGVYARGGGGHMGGGGGHMGGGGWSGGGWGWGAADDALAGMAVGAAIGAAASQPSTIVVEQPSTTVVQQSAPAAPAYGTQVTQLPGGCTSQNVHGVMAYQCGSTWYRPYFGANGVYYEVVSPPPAEGSVSTAPAQQAQ